jgi:two-component system phosphate regulon response regulator OmpR
MTRVLLIDDDEPLGALLQKYLGQFGFKLTSAATPESGLRQLRAETYDIVVLDVMLPGMDGFSVLRRIRESNGVPVVMLTARGDVTDRIIGLESGADDYLPKPFEPRELVARLHAVLRRRTGAEPDEVIRAGVLVLNAATRTVTVDARPVALTGAEFDLLLLLVRHRGRVLSRDRILDETRGADWDSFDRSIDVMISRLRQKLGDDVKRPSFIRTVRGKGYVLTADES